MGLVSPLSLCTIMGYRSIKVFRCFLTGFFFNVKSISHDFFFVFCLDMAENLCPLSVWKLKYENLIEISPLKKERNGFPRVDGYQFSNFRTGMNSKVCKLDGVDFPRVYSFRGQKIATWKNRILLHQKAVLTGLGNPLSIQNWNPRKANGVCHHRCHFLTCGSGGCPGLKGFGHRHGILEC